MQDANPTNGGEQQDSGVRASEGYLGYEDAIDLGAVFERLVAGKWIIALVTALCMVVAIAYLNVATYEYTVTYSVIPAQSEGKSDGGGGVGSLASLAGFALGGGGDTLQFDLYLDGLTSVETARELLRDESLIRRIFASEWDDAAQRWTEPSGFGVMRRRLFDRLTGWPEQPWQSPGAIRVSAMLDRLLEIEESGGSQIVIVSMEHPNPELAVDLLTALNATVDARLRARTLARAEDSVRFLRRALAEANISEVRLALAQALSAREQERMLASSTLPFAADVISEAIATRSPTSPQPRLALSVALVLGLLIGAALVLFRADAGR